MAINDIVLLCIILIFTLSGFISGFIKSVSKVAPYSLGVLGSFYLGSYISKLFIQNIESVKNYCASNEWCSYLILIASYLVVFLIIMLLCKLIFNALETIFSAGTAGVILNKLFGLVFGICLGFIICDIYCWGLYLVANVSESGANWVITDCKLNDESAFTLTKALIQINLNAINATFPHL